MDLLLHTPLLIQTSLVDTEKARSSQLIESLHQRIERSEKERDEATSSEGRISREWKEHKMAHDEEREKNIETIKVLEVWLFVHIVKV